MKIDELIISEECTALEAMHRLDETGLRIVFIAPDGVLKAVVTDADLRRFVLKGGMLTENVSAMANYSPRSLPVSERSRAKEYLLSKSIDAVPLLDKEGRIQDIVFVNDLDVDTRKKADIPVVITAGGLGTRLYPYTKILPKPLIPVGELPIVEHIIERFKGFGCSEFSMIVNYKKSMIKSYFSEVEKDYSLEFIDEDTPLGTGGGLSLLKGKLNRPFFFTNCDCLIDADYGDIYKFHRENKNIITMVCAFKHFTIPYGVIDLDTEGGIKNITEKPEMNFLTNTGIYLVEPRVVEEMEYGVACGFPDIIEKYRTAGEKVGVYPVSENSWMDMGQLEELETMRRR
ncbi:MAG: sugar phosphate nucleotidyltransferase, partial [Oscillospiraceae bacterium]